MLLFQAPHRSDPLQPLHCRGRRPRRPLVDVQQRKKEGTRPSSILYIILYIIDIPQVGKKKPHTFVCGVCWHYLSSRAVARQVLSAQMSLTSVFGMGTGGPSSQSIPTRMDGL